jgi:Uma2 family endonuclease
MDSGDVKLKLYTRRGVDEYWIADWRLRMADVYRRVGDRLELVATLAEGDMIESPPLPGFSVRLNEVFGGLSSL